MAKIKNRLGEKGINNQGLEMEIVEFNNSDDLVVKIIKYNELIHTQYRHFKEGNIKSKYYPTIYNKGFIGQANSRNKDGKLKKSYIVWNGMLRRCYSLSDDDRNRYIAYNDCEVCDEWLCYENFEKWYDSNYYEVDNFKMNIDKDIIKKGNRIYSPDNCIIVPDFINGLFIKSLRTRGDLPIGVYYDNKNGYKNFYHAKIKKENKSINLGSFSSQEEAFNAYKIAKEAYIKEIADKYKEKIPKRLYDALYKYNVDIDD